MARMHSRKKGKSKSYKPYVTEIPSWVYLKEEEVITLLTNFYKKGISLSELGSKLRDQYAVPSIKLVCKKKLSTLLNEAKLLPEFPEDLINLIKRAINLRKHLRENRKDLSSTHGLKRIESKIYRLASYYRKSKRIPIDWKYSPNTAGILVR